MAVGAVLRRVGVSLAQQVGTLMVPCGGAMRALLRAGGAKGLAAAAVGSVVVAARVGVSEEESGDLEQRVAMAAVATARATVKAAKAVVDWVGAERVVAARVVARVATAVPTVEETVLVATAVPAGSVG